MISHSISIPCIVLLVKDKAVIKGRNLQHLLWLSSLDVTGGESEKLKVEL